jgi:FkbH-like protein
MSHIEVDSLSLGEKIELFPFLETKGTVKELFSFYSQIQAKDVLLLSSKSFTSLESILSKYKKEWDLIKPIIKALEEAGEEQPKYKKAALWAKYTSGKITVPNEELEMMFAPYFHLSENQSLTLAKDFFKAGENEKAFTYLNRLCQYTDDFNSLVKASKLLKKIKKSAPDKVDVKTKVKVALLGGMTTPYLVPLLEACGLGRSFDLEIYEAEYNMIDVEILNPQSELHRFEPDIILTLPVIQNVDTKESSIIEKEQQRWTNLWKKVDQSLKARIIHLLYDYGDKEGSPFLSHYSPDGLSQTVEKINAALVSEGSQHGITFINHAGIAEQYGRLNWIDDKYWAMAKQPISMNLLPRLARHIIANIGIAYGRSKRCIAVDLDNTLWGGVLGEEGIHGVLAGNGDGESEEFIAFQQYLLDQTQRGCILVALSKNDEDLVKECFEARKDDFIIQWKDFTTTRINWTDKSQNLKSVSEELSLSTEHFVFIDDNPTERNRVRQILPDVTVPELPKGVSGYIREVDRHLLFEIQNLTKEDKARKESYKANAQRKELESNTGSFEDYLKSLDMVLTHKFLDDTVMERAAQLVSKTNQFNLTTKRYSQSALQEMAESKEHFPLCYRLVDRFGDYGWISLVILKVNDSVLDIDTWLMSCRVLGKAVEETVLSDMITIAQNQGCTEIRGTYIPTKKNGLVAGLYERLGFNKLDNDGNFCLSLSEPREEKTILIRRNEIAFDR